MLDSALGIRLLLWIGKVAPAPPPPAVLQALTSVRVINDAQIGDGFQLAFTLAKAPGADFSLLSSRALDVFNRVVIGVVIGARPEVLIDGIITNHELSPSDQPGQSTLNVTGKDVSVMMDLEERDEQFPNQSDAVIVGQVVSSYAQYGLQCTPVPTVDQPIELQRTPRQVETD